jgi:N-acetylated-alpha-linked acidic dipeptidase
MHSVNGPRGPAPAGEPVRSRDRKKHRLATTTDAITTWSAPALERRLLDAIDIDRPWDIVERFSRIVRLSGTPEERSAFDLLTARLDEWGIPYTLHEPECFISHPGPTTLRLEGLSGKSFRAKTAAMGVSTDGAEISGELVYVPSDGGEGAGDVFAVGVALGGRDVAGKVVMTEGFASPGKVTDVMAAGAIAGIFINAGEAIHEGICTPIWGTPDLDNQDQQPTIPVIAIDNPSGQELIAAAGAGNARVTLSTRLETRWRTIPVLVAEIPGANVPDEFVLLHGHLDSWFEGVADNATGDATMLELARVFWDNRRDVARSLRVAWWSGHSHGRYAGSTWYADEFAIELARDCVAQVNCDSPGARWVNSYDELSAMTETVPLVDRVIRETTGITPETERPPRAGDYSFNGIGLSGFYMLSSTMNQELRDEKGYYPVGGCGANIEWHTEGDLLEIADRDNLLRDIRVYATSLLRVLNAGAVPFDFTRTTAEFRATLQRYQLAAGSHFSFGKATQALDDLDAALAAFYAAAPVDAAPESDEARRFNFAQRRLARLLVPVNYSRAEAFYHDPALGVPELPDLAPALSYGAAGDDVAKLGVLRAHLTRGQNRLVWALIQATETAQAATGR